MRKSKWGWGKIESIDEPWRSEKIAKATDELLKLLKRHHPEQPAIHQGGEHELRG